MAPKRAREEEAQTDEASAAEADESKRIQDAAYDRGVITKTKRMVTAGQLQSGLPFTADGKDIVKKSSQRKGRYLLNINAQLSAATAGKLGTLAQLDTRNPVLYIDFPEGRLKFKGTLMFPKTKYMVLRFSNKDALCEDILESMVVFSESFWIGTKEENPDEHPMPLPASLKIVSEEEAAVKAETALKAAPKTSQKDVDPGEEPSQRPSQRPSQLRQRTPRRYAESLSDGIGDSDDASSREDDDGTDENDDDQRHPVDKAAGKTKQSTLLSFVQSQSQAQEKKTPVRKKAAAPRAKITPKAKPGSAISAGAKKRRRQVDSDSSDEADESDSDVQDVDASQAPSRVAPRRTARATPKKTIIDKDSDLDVIEEEDDDDFEI